MQEEEEEEEEEEEVIEVKWNAGRRRTEMHCAYLYANFCKNFYYINDHFFILIFFSMKLVFTLDIKKQV